MESNRFKIKVAKDMHIDVEELGQCACQMVIAAAKLLQVSKSAILSWL